MQNWLEVHAKKVESLGTKDQRANDPIYCLLCKIAGVKGPRLRAQTAEQLSAKSSVNNLRECFDLVFNPETQAKKERPVAYQAFIQSQFEELLKEMQKEFWDLAKAEVQGLKQERQSSTFKISLLMPTETQQ